MDLDASNSNNGEENPNQDPQNDPQGLFVFDDIDSNCSTPYVSAPSSPGRGGGGYFYSAPASPMHFALTSGAAKILSQSPSCLTHEAGSFEFGFGGPAEPSMSSADELFLNGQIRPMKLSSHLERPQMLAPLLDLDEEDPKEEPRGRDLRLREKNLRRRTRSMSPMRHTWHYDDEDDKESAIDKIIDKDDINVSKIESLLPEENNSTPSVSASSSRSSSAGRSSKRWVFLKDFLRSKSEGSSHNKFWATISLKEKRPSTSSSGGGGGGSVLKENSPQSNNNNAVEPEKAKRRGQGLGRKAKPMNGSSGKRRVPPSPHELHYTANRAQAEELRKKTFLPYRQGLLGCLGFSSKGYGAMNGFARALNPVSSR